MCIHTEHRHRTLRKRNHPVNQNTGKRRERTLQGLRRDAQIHRPTAKAKPTRDTGTSATRCQEGHARPCLRCCCRSADQPGQPLWVPRTLPDKPGAPPQGAFPRSQRKHTYASAKRHGEDIHRCTAQNRRWAGEGRHSDPQHSVAEPREPPRPEPEAGHTAAVWQRAVLGDGGAVVSGEPSLEHPLQLLSVMRCSQGVLAYQRHLPRRLFPCMKHLKSVAPAGEVPD